MNAFDALMAFQRQTTALAQIAGRLGWDQETVMPRGASAQRGEEMAAIEAVLHARRCDPRVGEWLAAATPPNAAGRAQLQDAWRRPSPRGRSRPTGGRARCCCPGRWRRDRPCAGCCPSESFM